MRNRLIPGLVFVVGMAFGAPFDSAVFTLNTSNAVGQAVSGAFICSTDPAQGLQNSARFTCSTDQLRDQQASVVFQLNSRSPEYGSAIFLADTHSVLMDSNTNGLPNIWEMRYFDATMAVAMPSEDSDDDGMSNLDEYTAGTHPLDDQSTFVVYFNRGFVEWPTVMRRLYTLQHAASLTNSFSDVSGCIDVPGTGDWSYGPAVSADSNGFYRVQVRVAE
jgi:hypothetical protein